MTDLLFGALALVLVFEGLLPFLSPKLWRQVFERATRAATPAACAAPRRNSTAASRLRG